MLTFPKDIATYSQVREISAAADSPIYIRDVEKADRQDDNAATRLFSGATLEWLVKNHPEHLGLMMYLFICGELIDAYQNRFLTLVERAKMVLRSHYFIELWENFLETAGYPKSRHYVSPQCADIARVLIQGFFQALIIYRDYSGPIRPLLLWLLATEVIEHVFGLSRQLVKDFTMLDFHYMIPKLFIQLRQAALSSKFTDGKATASGYSHTYTDTRGIDIQALSMYPTNSDLDDVAKVAYGEAESLFGILGVTASDLFYERSGNGVPAMHTRLPGIHSWFKDEVNAIFIDGLDDNSDDDDRSDSDSEPDHPEGIKNYQEALDHLEDVDNDLSSAKARPLMDHRYASIALSVNDYQKMYVLHLNSQLSTQISNYLPAGRSSMAELDENETEEAFSEDADQIAAILLDCAGREAAALLPSIKDSLPENPFGSIDPSSVDLSVLTDLRFAHQTKQAASGIRTSKSAHSDLSSISTATKALSDRQKILRGFAEIIRERGEKGIGSGLERAARWRNPAPGGRASDIDGAPAPHLAAGNSENAAAVAGAAAKKVSPTA